MVAVTKDLDSAPSMTVLHPRRGPNFRAIIAHQSLFRLTSPAAQADIAQRVRMRAFARGTHVMSEKEPSDSLLILHQGRIKLVLEGPGARRITVAILTPGEIFGENAALDGGQRGINAVALEASTVLVLPRDQLLRHLDRHPETAITLLTELSRRLRQRTELIANLSLREVTSRLARVLLQLGRPEHADDAVHLVIGQRPTHRELAEMIGTRRETISRTMTDLARQGLIATQGRRLVLSPALRTLAV